jgi:hypothetical protein
VADKYTMHPFLKSMQYKLPPEYRSGGIAAWLPDWTYQVKIDLGDDPGPDLSKYPHKCPRCGAAAYVGLVAVDCSGKCHA